MSDLSDLQAAQTVKVAGANSSGTETNYANADSNGNLNVIDYATAATGASVPSNAGYAAGRNPSGNLTGIQVDVNGYQMIVGSVASGATDSGNPVKVGGVFNTTFPTLSDGQRGDIQLDSSARQIIAPLTNTSVVKAQLQDNAGASLTLGQKTQTASLPVVIASNQSVLSTTLLDKTGVAIDSLSSGTGLNSLNIAMTGTNFILSTVNSTVVQLAVNSTFTGTIESIFNQQAISLLLTSDQNGTLTLNQYIDLAGTRKTSVLTFSIIAGVPFNRCIQGNGNFFNLTFRNTGSATTTTLNINTAYGTLPSVTALGNGPVSIDEVNGIPSSARPDGFLRVAADPTTLIYDTFETYDTTTTWTAGGTVPPTGGTGNLAVAPGTAANATSYSKSQYAFTQGVNAYLQYLGILSINATTVTGNKRFWGLGSFTTPTFAIPVTDGAVFEIDDVTGSLFASIYSNSIRTQTSTLVRPTDGTPHRYAIYYRASRVYFELDGVVVSTFAFPNPTIGTQGVIMGSLNGSGALATAPTLSVTATGIGDSAKNTVKISDGRYPWRQATITPSGVTPLITDPAVVVTISPNSPSLSISPLPATGSKFSFGDVTTAAQTLAVVTRTAYTEQTTNAQRSFASSSANDTSAGTGARTIRLTYLDQTGAGPFTETITLNGTSRVNTVATNVCFIEKIEVITAGSTGSNVGIISIYTVATAGGSVFGTIAATDNQTLWAHHYVPTGKTSFISGFAMGSNSTTVGGGANFILKTGQPTVANSVELQVSDFVTLYGQSSTNTREYSSPIQVPGPARIRAYVTPSTSASTVYRASFDFIDN